jgi:hypothetical protein
MDKPDHGEINIARLNVLADASKITAGVTSALSAKGESGKSSERGSSAKAGDKRRSSNGAKGHHV